MAATAAGFGRAHLTRVVLSSRRNRPSAPAPYVAPHDYIPSSTVDLWRSARRYAR